MSLMRELSFLTVRLVLADRAESLLGFLGDRYSDNARRLENALQESSDRAWRSLELALAGPTLWQSMTGMLSTRDQQGLVHHLQTYLAGLPAGLLPADNKGYRKLCLAELRSARKVGLVPGATYSVHAVAGEVQTFARYGDRQRVLDHERTLLDGMSGVLHREGYTNLAHCVSLRPDGGDPLVVLAARHFFRREIESDPKLAAGLTMERLENLSAGQQAGFDGLHEALTRHGAQLEGLLGGLTQAVTETRDIVSGTHDEVRTLRNHMEQQSDQIRHLSEMLKKLLEVRPEPASPIVPTSPVVAPVVTATAPVAASKPIPAPVPVPVPAISAAPSTTSTEWDQVRQLLARATRVARDQPQARPELSSVVQQLTQATQTFEATRRSYLQIQGDDPAKDPLPLVPPDRVQDALPVEAPTSTARLISPLFAQQTPPVEAKPAGDAQPANAEKPTRKKYISPLFDRPPS